VVWLPLAKATKSYVKAHYFVGKNGTNSLLFFRAGDPACPPADQGGQMSERRASDGVKPSGSEAQRRGQ